jgi:thiol-disulfide isomerase/thioredoxin
MAGLVGVVGLGLAAAMACGRPAPRPADPHAEHARLDFTLKDVSGKDVTLASFGGAPLIINFWATYCGPCKAEIPMLNDLVTTYRAQRLAVVGISYDDPPADILKFVQTTPMNYPKLVGLGHDDLMDAYGAIALPTTWILRADGTVVAKHTGPEPREWFDAQVRAAL